MKKKIFINVLVILAIVISINFNMKIKAAGNEFVGQSDGKSEQQIIDEIKITNKEIVYETNITFISHGLMGKADHWSNTMGSPWEPNNEDFKYDSNSIIECLRRRCDADVYKIEECDTDLVINDNILTDVLPNSFKLKKLIIDNVTRTYKENEYVNSITSINNHIVVIYNASQEVNNKTSDFAYKELEFAINKITYDVVQLMETKVKINLIGHSRGGILNMKYAIDYPYNVDGLFSIGTPYNGTNLSSIYSLLASAGDSFGLTDLINSPGGVEITSTTSQDNPLKTDWLNMHQTYSPNINFHAIAGESGLTHLIKELDDAVGVNAGTDFREFATLLKSALFAIEKTYISSGIVPNAGENSSDKEPYKLQNLNVEGETIISTTTSISALLVLCGVIAGNEAILALSELLNNCYYSFDERELFLRSDLFSYTSSQLADGFEAGLDNSSILVNRYKKIFTENNSIYEMKSEDSVGIVHNSEAKDLEIINYILLNINLSGNDNKLNTCFIERNGIPTLAFMGVVIEDDENNVHVSLPDSIVYGLYGNEAPISKIRDVRGISKIFSKSFNNDKVTQVSIGKNISIIETGAFSSFDNVITFNVDINSEYFCSDYGSLYSKNKNYLIKYCNGLSSITEFVLPDNTENIEAYAFANNNYLTSVNLNNVITVGEKCFYNATNLVSIVGDQLNYAYDFAFHYTGWLDNISTNVSTSLGKVLIKYIGNVNKLVVDQYSCIYSYAFTSNSNLVEIICNVEGMLVDRYAFTDNSSLESIFLLSEITNIISPYSFVNNKDNELKCIILVSLPLNQYVSPLNYVNLSKFRNFCISYNTIYKFDLNCRNQVDNISQSTSQGETLIYRLDVDCAKSYKITANSSSEIEIKIYNENMDLIGNIVPVMSNNNLSGTITSYLNPGKYFLKLNHVNNYAAGEIEFSYKATWPVEKYGVQYSDVSNKNDILNHLHKENRPTGYVYKNELAYANYKSTGFYEIKLTGKRADGTTFDSFPEGAIKIYNSADKNNLMKKFSFEEISQLAKSSKDSNTIYVYLTRNTGYYIDIELYDRDFVSLYLDITLADIQEIDVFDLNYLTLDENIDILNDWDEKSDYIRKIKIEQACKVELEVAYEGSQQENVTVVLIKIEYDSLMNEQTIILKYFEQLNKYKKINDEEVTFELEPGCYYIGYFNLINGEMTAMKLKRIVSNTVTDINGGIITDPDSQTPCGSQLSIIEKDVEPLNKSYRGTDITVGFTRLIYLDLAYAPSISRLDYYWYSSSDYIATVTEYGTVLGRNVGTVKIMAVYKDDPSIIYVKEFDIETDNEVTPLNLEIYQTHSLSEDGTYQITLTAQNSPYVFLQYYSWSLYVPDQETNITASLDIWGYVAATDIGDVVITGNYILNSRITVTIYLTFTV